MFENLFNLSSVALEERVTLVSELWFEPERSRRAGDASVRRWSQLVLTDGDGDGDELYSCDGILRTLSKSAAARSPDFHMMNHLKVMTIALSKSKRNEIHTIIISENDDYRRVSSRAMIRNHRDLYTHRKHDYSLETIDWNIKGCLRQGVYWFINKFDALKCCQLKGMDKKCKQSLNAFRLRAMHKRWTTLVIDVNKGRVQRRDDVTHKPRLAHTTHTYVCAYFLCDVDRSRAWPVGLRSLFSHCSPACIIKRDGHCISLRNFIQEICRTSV